MLQNFGRATGRFLRSAGQALDRVGVRIQGSDAYIERAVTTTRLVPFQDKTPVAPSSTFVAPNATVIGDVSIGEKSSIWYEAIVRGDVNYIKIGQQSNLQERVVVHVSRNVPAGGKPLPTVIGNKVTVAAGAHLHACTLHDECYVGMGATILDGAVVEKHAAVAGGAVILPGTVVKAGELWAGVPAQRTRALTEEEKQSIQLHADDVYHMASIHQEETSKSPAQIIREAEESKRRSRLSEDWYLSEETETDADKTSKELQKAGLW